MSCATLRWLGTGLAFLIVGLCAIPAPAAASTGCALSEAEIAQRVARFSDDLIQATRLAEQNGLRGFDSLEATVVALTEVGTSFENDDGRELCRVFTRFPGLELAPQRLIEVLERTAGGAEGSGCLSLPPDLLAALQVDYFVLRESELILAAICNSTQCLPAVCKISCPLAGAAKFLTLTVGALLEENDYCGKDTHFGLVADFALESDRRLTAVERSLWDVVVPVVDIDSRVLASQELLDDFSTRLGDELGDRQRFSEDLRDVVEAQEVERSELERSELRSRIEANLQPGEEARLVTFQLPESFGGYLETVREIVAETLQTLLDAGFEVGDGLGRFSEGDAAFNQQQFRRAFSNYRAAYQAALDAQGMVSR